MTKVNFLGKKISGNGPSDPPAGYLLLGDHVIIVPGDIIHSVVTDGWRGVRFAETKVEVGGLAASVARRTQLVNKGEQRPDATVVSDKKPAKIPSVPDGYRLVLSNEYVTKGDRIWNSASKAWNDAPVKYYGRKASTFHYGVVRRLTIIPPDGFRIVAKQSVVRDTHRIFVDSKWIVPINGNLGVRASEFVAVAAPKPAASKPAAPKATTPKPTASKPAAPKATTPKPTASKPAAYGPGNPAPIPDSYRRIEPTSRIRPTDQFYDRKWRTVSAGMVGRTPRDVRRRIIRSKLDSSHDESQVEEENTSGIPLQLCPSCHSDTVRIRRVPSKKYFVGCPRCGLCSATKKSATAAALCYNALVQRPVLLCDLIEFLELSGNSTYIELCNLSAFEDQFSVEKLNQLRAQHTLS